MSILKLYYLSVFVVDLPDDVIAKFFISFIFHLSILLLFRIFSFLDEDLFFVGVSVCKRFRNILYKDMDNGVAVIKKLKRRLHFKPKDFRHTPEENTLKLVV